MTEPLALPGRSTVVKVRVMSASFSLHLMSLHFPERQTTLDVSCCSFPVHDVHYKLQYACTYHLYDTVFVSIGDY